MLRRGKGGKGMHHIHKSIDFNELQRCFRPSTYVFEDKRGGQENASCSATPSQYNGHKKIRTNDNDNDTTEIYTHNVTDGITSRCEYAFATVPSMWMFLATFEHFRMSSVSKTMRNAALSDEHLWRLRHQREFWHTAREFHSTGSNSNSNNDSHTDEDTTTITIDYDHDIRHNNHPEFWQIFIRGNILRTISSAPTKRDNYKTYYAIDEKVTIFGSTEECKREEELLCDQYRGERNMKESSNFHNAYFKRSLPCWIFAVGKEKDFDANPPLYISKVGGTPPKYPLPGEDEDRGIGRSRWKLGKGRIFLFQVDLSTVPIRLREHLGGNGLLQFFFDSDSWYHDGGLKVRIIPSKDFHKLVPGTPCGEVDGAPIVGWTEKNDFSERYQDCDHIKFGGFAIDYNHGIVEPSIKKNIADGRLSMNYFEIRGADNIFGVNLRESGQSSLWGDFNNCIFSMD